MTPSQMIQFPRPDHGSLRSLASKHPAVPCRAPARRPGALKTPCSSSGTRTARRGLRGLGDAGETSSTRPQWVVLFWALSWGRGKLWKERIQEFVTSTWRQMEADIDSNYREVTGNSDLDRPQSFSTLPPIDCIPAASVRGYQWTTLHCLLDTHWKR